MNDDAPLETLEDLDATLEELLKSGYLQWGEPHGPDEARNQYGRCQHCNGTGFCGTAYCSCQTGQDLRRMDSSRFAEMLVESQAEPC